MSPPPDDPIQTPDDQADPIALRIRARRKAAGLSLAQLAARAGLSAPSHILHIENGSKCPSEDVAMRLARALGEDPDLYRDWARARNRSGLVAALAAARRLEARLAQMGLAAAPAEPAATPHAPPTAAPPANTRGSQPPASDHRPAAAPSAPPPSAPATGPDPAAMMRVPVIPGGDDPGDGIIPQARVLRSLRLDPQLLPPLEQLRRPFAYAIAAGAGAMRHLVISRQFETLLDRDRTAETALAGPRFAIRTRAGVVLLRARWDGATLHRADDGEPRSYPADANRLREIVVGTVVLEIRTG